MIMMMINDDDDDRVISSSYLQLVLTNIHYMSSKSIGLLYTRDTTTVKRDFNGLKLCY